MRKKILVASIISMATLAGISAASANPIYIGYKIGAGALTLAASGAGTANFNSTVSGITFQLSGLGSPFLSAPNLQSSEIVKRNNSGPGTLAIQVYISQTGLAASPDFFEVGFANNGLGRPISVAAYAQSCLVAGCGSTIASGDVFATTNLLYSTPLTPGAGGTMTVPSPAMAGLYNETLVYTFNLARNQLTNANLSLTGVNVPEPLTLSLFGAGLAGMAAVRRRRVKQAA